VVDIVVKAFGKAFIQSSSMLPYQELQLGQWKLLLMKSGHHNSLVQQVGEGNPCLVDFSWAVRFLGLCKVKKTPISHPP
jgi:hypothetical protein